jgi:dihydropyrimidinase
MLDIIIKNGNIVTPSMTYKGDVGVKDGRIVLIGEKLDMECAVCEDVSGKYVLPGAVDAHVHLKMVSNGIETADDYEAGTRAAACGGTTTVIDYAVQTKGRGIVESVEDRLALAQGKACVDYGFHCVITHLNGGSLLDEFAQSVNFGVTSFKCFMVYKREGLMIDDGELTMILSKAAEHGVMTNVHAENADVLYNRVRQYLDEGHTSPWYHYMSRPEFVESEADMRIIHWAKALGAPVYIVHLASKAGVEAVIAARDEGYPVYAETCPQYLEFTHEVYKRADGRNFVCSPPIKGEASRAVLWRAIETGHISTIATDHCPYTQAQKDQGMDNFVNIPNGCAGVEIMYPYMLSAANQGKISFEKAVEVCCANPARIFGCDQKGNLVIGADADIVIYDPDIERKITHERMHSDTDHTIWEGLELKGFPEKVYSRGTLVYDNGAFTGKPGHGRYLKRK